MKMEFLWRLAWVSGRSRVRIVLADVVSSFFVYGVWCSSSSWSRAARDNKYCWLAPLFLEFLYYISHRTVQLNSPSFQLSNRTFYDYFHLGMKLDELPTLNSVFAKARSSNRESFESQLRYCWRRTGIWHDRVSLDYIADTQHNDDVDWIWWWFENQDAKGVERMK